MTMTAAPPPASPVPASKTDTWVMPSSPPPTTQPPRRASAGIAGGLILIALGLVFLGTNLFAAPGALLFLGLGCAFLIARIVTDQYGFSVPAGILLGFGAFVGLTEYGVLNGPDAGGAFFVFLGLGFFAVYLIGARPSVVWPVLPSVALIGFGMFIQMVTTGWPLQGLVWLADYWPVAVVALGVWLLLRDYLPPAARMPVAVAGASILVLIGFLVAAAGVATVVNPAIGGTAPLPWSGLRPLTIFGSPPLQDTRMLSAPVGPVQSISVSNTSGRTLVRSGQGPEVTVTATRHYWTPDAAPEVRLTPQGSTLTIDTAPRTFDVQPGFVDYIIDLPASTGASLRSSSGEIEIVGISGATTVQTTSGSVRVDNVSGELRVTTTSGDVRGVGVERPRQVQTTSGTIDLTTAVQSDARVATTSGEVHLRLTGEPSVRVDIGTSSGDIRTSGLPLGAERRATRSLVGTLGSGAINLEVRTASGDITLSR